MTEIEAQATGGYGEGTASGSFWTQLLVPIVAAVLVLALGLVWVSLTSDSSRPTASTPASEVGIF